jgi:hypothetical protein
MSTLAMLARSAICPPPWFIFFCHHFNDRDPFSALVTGASVVCQFAVRVFGAVNRKI